MKVRLTIPVLLALLLLTTVPVPGLAAGAPRPAIHHCGADSNPIPYPSLGLDSTTPHLDGYAIPYPRVDLDGDSHNCLGGDPTPSEDGNGGGSFVRYAIPSPPAGLDANAPRLGSYAIPYPVADLDGDSRPSTLRYVVPYPSTDLGDGEAYLVR